MTDHADQVSGAAPNIDPHDALKVVRAVALILRNNSLRYWLSPRDAEDAADGAYARISEMLDRAGSISFRLAERALSLSGHPLPGDDSLVSFFADLLYDRGLADLRLEEGMTREEFRGFLDLLNAGPEVLEARGGFTGAVTEAGLSHVKVRQVVFKEVAEDEVVIHKDRSLGDAEESIDREMLAGIVAFLRGEVVEPDEQLRSKVREVASDAEKMVELIMRSADIRQEAATLEGGESLASVVVGSLRRAFGKLKEQSGSRSQKARKQLSKTLVLLEREVLDTIRDIARGDDDDTALAVGQVIEELQEELEVGALASDFLRSRASVDQSERRILRYMRSKGPDAVKGGVLHQQLEADGLAAQDWQELLIKSRQGASLAPAPLSAMPGEEGLVALGQLARLLSQLELIVGQATEKQHGRVTQQLAETVTTVRHAVKGAMAGTQEKIEELRHEIEEEEKAEKKGSGKGKRSERRRAMSRKRMLTILAEIVQELCQPLSVIGCSLQMVSSGRLGQITESQLSMLNLANESAERISMLTDSLRQISGEPDTLEPDLGITSSFYE